MNNFSRFRHFVHPVENRRTALHCVALSGVEVSGVEVSEAEAMSRAERRIALH